MLVTVERSRLAKSIQLGLLVLALTSCGQGGDLRCAAGSQYDYTAEEPGEPTRKAAVDAFIDSTEVRVERLASLPADYDRDLRLKQMRAELSALRALRAAADAGREGTLEATDAEGEVVARANFTAHPAGGLVIGSLEPEPGCRE